MPAQLPQSDPADDLQPNAALGNDAHDGTDPFANQESSGEIFPIPISDVFDLHSIQPREIEGAVEEYLREAHGLGLRALRIIHGRGIGVQRETVRRVLARTPFVAAFGDALPEAGGWGATVVTLRNVTPQEPLPASE